MTQQPNEREPQRTQGNQANRDRTGCQDCQGQRQTEGAAMRPANESAKADANRTKNIAKAETLEVDAKQISNTERIQSGSGCQKKL
jgi:hypothetical protein